MNSADRARLEFLRGHVDVLTFCASFAHFQRAGRQLRALCPIHGERDPSFYISPDRRHWFCHGCNLGGDLFALVMFIFGCDFREAVRQVARVAAGRPMSLSRRAPRGSTIGAFARFIDQVSEKAEKGRLRYERIMEAQSC